MDNPQKEELLNKFRDKLLYVNYSTNTVMTYIRYVNLFLTWCPIELENLTPVHITEFMGTLADYSASSKNNILKSYLPAFFKFSTNVGILKVNPLTLMKIPTAKSAHKEMEILSGDEMKKMVENPAGRGSQVFRNKVLLKLLASTGIRISEALSLCKKDIKDNKILIHGKGAKERMVNITTTTYKILQEYLRGIDVADDKSIFDLSRQWAMQVVIETAKINEIDKKVTPHTFRHSFATFFCANGGNESTLKKIMGWNRNFPTHIYVDLANVDVSKEVLKITEKME